MVFPKFGNFGGILRSGVIEGVGADLFQLAARSLIKGSLRSELTMIFGPRNDKLQGVYDATPLSC
jgi:hypothetical protein